MKIDNSIYALRQKYDDPYYEDVLEYEYVDEFIPSDDLPKIIKINNEEMYDLINHVNLNALIATDANAMLSGDYLDDFDRIKALFLRNMNFYRIANYRGLSIPGKEIMLRVATLLPNVDCLKIYQELYGHDPIKIDSQHPQRSRKH